jgi:hypothetical protein
MSERDPSIFWKAEELRYMISAVEGLGILRGSRKVLLMKGNDPFERS